MFCSGKVYFDLLEARRAESRQDVALVRIEQLYPFPGEEYSAVLGALPAVRARSSGARKSRRTRAPGTRSAIACRSWPSARRDVLYAGRAPAAAPATGIGKIHEPEQQTLVHAALHATTTEETGRDRSASGPPYPLAATAS